MDFWQYIHLSGISAWNRNSCSAKIASLGPHHRKQSFFAGCSLMMIIKANYSYWKLSSWSDKTVSSYLFLPQIQAVWTYFFNLHIFYTSLEKSLISETFWWMTSLLNMRSSFIGGSFAFTSKNKCWKHLAHRMTACWTPCVRGRDWIAQNWSYVNLLSDFLSLHTALQNVWSCNEKWDSECFHTFFHHFFENYLNSLTVIHSRPRSNTAIEDASCAFATQRVKEGKGPIILKSFSTGHQFFFVEFFQSITSFRIIWYHVLGMHTHTAGPKKGRASLPVAVNYIVSKRWLMALCCCTDQML